MTHSDCLFTLSSYNRIHEPYLLFENVRHSADLDELDLRLVATRFQDGLVQATSCAVEDRLLSGDEQHRTTASSRRVQQTYHNETVILVANTGMNE